MAQAQKSAHPQTPMRERILAAAFRAFTENGYAGTSTLAIATCAKVSKRDLYAHFGGKQAILVACIRGRATRMRLPPNLPAPHSPGMLAAALCSFGMTLLREACDPVVIAMLRLAIAEAEHAPEVACALDDSRTLNRAALAAHLAAAQKAGILGDGDPREMTEQFFALLWGDLLMNRLLGTQPAARPAEMERRARRAVAAFLGLHGRPEASDGHGGPCGL